MSRKLSFAMILGASALVWTGCDDNDDPDGGVVCGGDSGVICLDDGGTDAGRDEVDSGMVDPGDCTLVEGRTTGAACILGSTCHGGLECEEQGGGLLQPIFEDGTPAVEMGPAGEPVPVSLAVRWNTGSMCSETCPIDGADTCGDCASCGNGGLVGRVGFSAGQDSAGNALGLCRQTCTPSETDRGGCREGYACDPTTNTCVDACTSDVWCKIVDVTVLDGFIDDFVYDPTFPATCNMDTGRCEFQACLVGAEPEADQLGTGGHGAGCEAGQSCAWDGSSAPDADPNGICIPGEYNDITDSNVGAACETAADCYSPYGYATCLFNTDENLDSGICTVSNCAVFDDGSGTAVDGILPGVAAGVTVCDTAAAQICVNFRSAAEPLTFCVPTCETGADCAAGYACADLLTGTDAPRLCWPNCYAQEDCSTGEMCLNEGGTACDANGPDGVPNTEDDESCWCGTETPPEPDAGVPDDAGTDADAGVADGGLDAGV